MAGQIYELFMGSNNNLFIDAYPNGIYRNNLDNLPPAYTLFIGSLDDKIGSSSQYFRIRAGELGSTEALPFAYALVPRHTEIYSRYNPANCDH